MHNLKELKIWNKAMELVVEVYKSTESFPSNIAEGAGRNSNNEFRHFLAISNGSLYELQTQLLISSH